MGGATIYPVPRAIDAEAHYYPRKWKRNAAAIYGGFFLLSWQIQRFSSLNCVSSLHLSGHLFLIPNPSLFSIAIRNT